MKICIDTDCLYTAKTGVRTYVTELSAALSRLGVQVVEIKRPASSFSVRYQKKFRPLLHIGRLLWTQVLLPLKVWRQQADALISPEYFTPYFSPVPNYVTLHDALFFDRKKDYGAFFRMTLSCFAWPSARKATQILTVSHHAKSEIVKNLSVSDAHVSVAYLGVKQFSQTTDRGRLSPDVFFLSVGVLEKRKNIINAIRAFAFTHKKYPHLKYYIVGQPAPFAQFDDSLAIREVTEELGLQDAVVLFGHVSDEQLASFYQNALALVFISTYEGFGLPILEGFGCRLPVLTSYGGATEEVAGNACELCHPLDLHSISQSMLRLVENQELREELVEKGLERVQQFTWDHMANKVADLVREKVRS